jgi:peptide deformylase
MATPPIVQAGHPVLRSPARPVEPDAIRSKEMQALVRRMIEAMRRAPGVGLAAPQIGVGLQVIVLEDDERLMGRLSPEERALRGRVAWPTTVLFNPQLTLIGDAKATFFEGCLSVSGWSALVERSLEVEVTGLDGNGEPVVHRASGWPARIFQHEVDHLRGTLYVDRMMTRTFGWNDEVTAYWARKPVDEVIAGLDARRSPDGAPERQGGAA